MQFLEFLSISKNVDYPLELMEFLSPSPKMWTIICIFLNFFPFPINMDYHMQFLEFLSFLQKRGLYHMQFLKFLSLLQKRGLSSAIFGISFPSKKMWTIICNLWNLILKTWTMISNLWNFFPISKNVDYHKKFLKFLSFLQKRGLLYA